MTPDLQKLLTWALTLREGEVLARFAALPRAQTQKSGAPYVYIPGTRPNRVLLVAHADTVHNDTEPVEVMWMGDLAVRKQQPKQTSGYGCGWNRDEALGADDRVGCAAMWLLARSGHSVLITSGEERGCVGARNAVSEIKDELAKHQFAIEIDRRGFHQIIFYDVGTPEFKQFVVAEAQKLHPEGMWREHAGSSTDICVICREVGICGVNFSAGYWNEHSGDEMFSVGAWLDTLKVVRGVLAQQDLPRFELRRLLPQPHHHARAQNTGRGGRGAGVAGGVQSGNGDVGASHDIYRLPPEQRPLHAIPPQLFKQLVEEKKISKKKQKRWLKLWNPVLQGKEASYTSAGGRCLKGGMFHEIRVAGGYATVGLQQLATFAERWPGATCENCKEPLKALLWDYNVALQDAYTGERDRTIEKGPVKKNSMICKNPQRTNGPSKHDFCMNCGYALSCHELVTPTNTGGCKCPEPDVEIDHTRSEFFCVSCRLPIKVFCGCAIPVVSSFAHEDMHTCVTCKKAIGRGQFRKRFSNDPADATPRRTAEKAHAANPLTVITCVHRCMRCASEGKEAVWKHTILRSGACRLLPESMCENHNETVKAYVSMLEREAASERERRSLKAAETVLAGKSPALLLPPGADQLLN